MTTAEASEYMIDRDWGPERERLELLASWQDPFTVAHLESLGAGEGWVCLEVGAGTGTIARWLGERVGRSGSVVAADIDTRYLADLPENVRVLEFDLRTEEFPEASFDLIHARFVLAHLPDRAHVLRRLQRWLRPGGWLLAEEPEGFAALAAPNPLWRSFWEATSTLAQVDIGCGRLLAPELRSVGFVDLDADVAVGMVRGGAPSGRFWTLTIEAMRPLLEDGLLPGAAIDELVTSLADPQFLELGPGCVAVWGRRP